MQTDRELLELAAKAAGYEVELEVSKHSKDIWRALIVTKGRQGGIYKTEWYPIDNDVDAFRLLCAVWSKIKDPREKFKIHQALDTGSTEQVRNAIVQAAASLSLHAETKE